MQFLNLLLVPFLIENLVSRAKLAFFATHRFEWNNLFKGYAID